MALKINTAGGGSGASKFEPLTKGVHAARLIRIIDLGMQRDEYQGEVKERHKLFLTFSVPGETIKIDGKDQPKYVSAEVTASFHEKAKLTGIVMALDPNLDLDGLLDITSLMGKGVQLNIGHTAGGNAKITTAIPLSKGQTVEDMGEPLEAFDFDNPDKAMFDTFPKFIQERIQEALDFKGFGNTVLPEVM